MKRKQCMMGLVICIATFMFGCGTKETVSDVTQKDITSQVVQETTEQVEQETIEIAEETLSERFEGTVVIDGIAITLPCYIGTAKNQEELVAYLEKVEQEELTSELLHFVYEDDTLPLVERIITGIDILPKGEPPFLADIPEGDLPFSVELTDGTSLIWNSPKDLKEKLGEPSIEEQLDSDDFMESDGILYEWEGGRIDYQTMTNFEEESPGDYEKAKYELLALSIWVDDEKVADLKESLSNQPVKELTSMPGIWKTGVFTLNDKNYSVKSPFLDFMEDGWKPHFKHSSLVNETQLKPGETTKDMSPVLTLEEESEYIRLGAKNWSNEEKLVKDCSLETITVLFTDTPFSLSGGIKKGSSVADVKTVYGEPITIVEMKEVQSPYGDPYPTFYSYFYQDTEDGWETEEVVLCLFVDEEDKVCGFRYRINEEYVAN